MVTIKPKKEIAKEEHIEVNSVEVLTPEHPDYARINEIYENDTKPQEAQIQAPEPVAPIPPAQKKYLVTPIDSYMARIEAEKKSGEAKTKREQVLEYLQRKGELGLVNIDEEYIYMSGNKKKNKGFYLDITLKYNFDNFLVRAVEEKWDGIFLMTGMEGSGKSTFASAICKYLDPTFPGEPLNDGTPRRTCDRVVFTPQQFSEAVARSKKKQAIQFDEAILGLMAGDAGMNVQKMLMKEITLIRKKQLYIVLVIPSIFSMRMPIAAQRSRFLIHTYSPDGIERGYFKFYNYPTKRQLYIKGKKDFNQDVIEADFRGSFSNTEGLFYDHDEYDRKKENAIKNITDSSLKRGAGGEGLTFYKTQGQRNSLLLYLYTLMEGEEKGKTQLEYIIKLQNEYASAAGKHGKLNPNKFKEWLDQVFGEHMLISESTLRDYLESAKEFLAKPIKPLERTSPAFVEQSPANEDI